MKNKSIILSLIVAAAVLIAVFMFMEEKPARLMAVVGQEAPNFELTDMEGRKVTLTDFRGKVVIVNFWATWCDTCRQEAPSLHALANDGKLDSKLEVVKILFRDKMSNASRYLKDNNYKFRVLSLQRAPPDPG